MLTPNVLLTNPGQVSLETDGFFLGFYYGLMLITIAYSCFLQQAFRDNICSLYVLYLLTHISFFSFANGVFKEYWWFHTPWWNSFIVPLTLGLNLLAFLLLNAKLFYSKDLSAPWHFAMKVLMAIASFIALLSPFAPFAFPKTLLLIITILTYGTIFVVTLLAWKQGSFLKPYFLLAQLLLIIAGLISNLVPLEFLPLNFPSKYLTLLYLAAVLFFSLANAYRLNAIMKEKAEAQSKFLCKQAEAIYQTQELNLTMQKTYEQLEKKVEKRTAELNKAKLDAEIANQTKSRFIANISHELRTPLNGILGYAQILQREADIDPAQKEAIDTIYKCGFHLLALINDILDISQIQGNQMTLYPKDFNLGECMAEVVNTVRPRAIQKKIAFNYQDNPELPKAVYADEKRLRQALLELLDNAIKFTEKGHVTFTVEVLETAAKTKSSQLAAEKIRFQIEDTGIGMTPEQLTRVFLPFEQLDNLPHKAEGTGLGLVISQKLIQMMGGDIDVKSSREKGTVVSFELELQLSSTILLKPKPEKIVNSANIVGFKGDKNKITAIDDNQEALSFLVDILESWGFIVSQANNGKEGLEAIGKIKPDLIIADMFMSVMDGLEMIKILRQAKEFDDVVIVTSSARGYNYEQQLSLEAGANDFIAKPIKIEELLEKLQANLDLEWIYKSSENTAETTEYLPADSSEIVLPPAAELEVIINAARIGDIYRIEEEANRIRQLDVAYITFADKIAELAGEFNDLEILGLVEQLTINN
ncbi:MAG: ATP-binding protein [Cyanobacteriota bacterium]|nr:ATP-binding protein [Cyanobacteriota bacterium]